MKGGNITYHKRYFFPHDVDRLLALRRIWT